MKRVKALSMQDVMSSERARGTKYRFPVKGRLSAACKKGMVKMGCKNCTMLGCDCKCHKTTIGVTNHFGLGEER